MYHEAIISWEAFLKDGKLITELQTNIKWNDIKNDVISLCLVTPENQRIYLPHDMEEYFQGKSAVGDLGSGKVTIISRYIGFRKGNIIVKIRRWEENGNISTEVEPA